MKKKLLSVLALASLGIGITLSSCGGNSGNNGGNGGNNGDEPPVTDTEKLVTDITLTEESKTLGVGATYQLEWTVAPSDADNKDVTFTSSDTKVATVSEDGLITAVATGTSTITVSSADKSDVTASFALTVEETKYITEVEFYGDNFVEYTIIGTKKGKCYYAPNEDHVQLQWRVIAPEDYNNDEICFYYDEDEISIDENGLVTFLGDDIISNISVFNPKEFAKLGTVPYWELETLCDDFAVINNENAGVEL